MQIFSILSTFPPKGRNLYTESRNHVRHWTVLYLRMSKGRKFKMYVGYALLKHKKITPVELKEDAVM